MTVSLPWAIALGAGFPVLFLILTELIGRARARGGSAPVLQATRMFLMPAGAAVAMLRLVLQRDGKAVLDRLSLTIFSIVLLHVVLGALNHLVFNAARAGTWRAQVPEMLRDIVRTLLVGLGAAFIYSEVWDKELAGALAALGVGSLVLGLALQEPLGNVFSGLMLLVEQPLATGDWVRVDSSTGRVVAMNWRAVNIRTRTDELVVVPNSSLYKASFANLSRPTPMRTEVLELGFSYDDPPNRVKDLLLQLLIETPGVLRQPAPRVHLLNLGDFSISYHAFFSVENQEALAAVREDVLTRVWYMARREGLTIPFPTSVEVQRDLPPAPPPQEIARDLLAPYPLFHRAADSGAGTRVLDFGRGEWMMTDGSEGDGLYLIISGKAAFVTRTAGGQAERMAGGIGPGDFYGEHSILAGRVNPMGLRAISDVRVVRFEVEAARRMVEESSQLAREVGAAIEQRRRNLQSEAARTVSSEAGQA